MNDHKKKLVQIAKTAVEAMPHIYGGCRGMSDPGPMLARDIFPAIGVAFEVGIPVPNLHSFAESLENTLEFDGALHPLDFWQGAKIELDRLEFLVESGLSPDRGEVPKKRGRLTKEESEARKALLLAKVNEHPGMMYDPATLGRLVGVSAKTAAKWSEEFNREWERMNTKQRSRDD